MASFDIGAKLRQERVGQGLTIDDISRDTKIAPRFLEAIETDDFSHIPSLVFTRNFVRQYALTLNLDPDPLLAELPKQDEATVQLPNPPARPRSSYQRDRRLHSIFAAAAWLLVVGAGGGAAYMFFNRPGAVPQPPRSHAVKQASNATPVKATPVNVPPVGQPAVNPPVSAMRSPNAAARVRVSLTAHDDAWVQVSADGKTTFVGTLKPNETKEVSASEQVKISTGNAGALTISLNGKTLASIGPPGEVRVVKLTVEGPEFLSKAPPPAPDPL